MPQSNFIIQDVVHLVSDEGAYRRRRTVRRALRSMLRKVWLFGLLAVFSGGLGYMAVQLPDLMGQSAGRAVSGGGLTEEVVRERLESMSGEQKDELRQKFEQLGDDEKKDLMRRFGGAR